MDNQFLGEELLTVKAKKKDPHVAAGAEAVSLRREGKDSSTQLRPLDAMSDA